MTFLDLLDRRQILGTRRRPRIPAVVDHQQRRFPICEQPVAGRVVRVARYPWPIHHVEVCSTTGTSAPSPSRTIHAATACGAILRTLPFTVISASPASCPGLRTIVMLDVAAAFVASAALLPCAE